MTDEPKRTREEQGNTFDFSCCRNWSRMKPDQTEGFDYTGMMARIMEMCGGAKSETAAPKEPDTPDPIV